MSIPGHEFVGIPNPAAGTWQIVQSPDSAAVTEVATANPLPEAEVAGSLGGKGRGRLLSYRATTGNGLTTKFFEKTSAGLAQLGVAKSKRGTIKFAPSDGPAGKRQIIAMVERNGMPRLQKTIATYKAPGPAKPGKVKKLKAKWRGKTITATWKKAAGATMYAVAFALPDGRTELQLVKGTRAVFKGAPAKGKLTVSVQARNRQGRSGGKAYFRSKRM